MPILIGTGSNQVPTNGDLGTMAFQDSAAIAVGLISATGNISTTSNLLVAGSVGIGTTTPAFKLDVSGTGRFTNNLTVQGVTNLGAVGNVVITGGSNNFVLSTNGLGVLSWVAPSFNTSVVINSTSPVLYPTFVNAQSGNLQINTDPDISFAPGSNVLTLGGVSTFATSTFAGLVNLRAYNETVANPTVSAGTLALDLATATIFNVAINANITSVTFSNANTIAAGTQASGFVMIANGTGTSYAIVWPASVRWPGNTAPTITSTAGKRDVLTFFSTDQGATFNSFISGQNL